MKITFDDDIYFKDLDKIQASLDDGWRGSRVDTMDVGQREVAVVIKGLVKISMTLDNWNALINEVGRIEMGLHADKFDKDTAIPIHIATSPLSPSETKQAPLPDRDM